MKRNFTIDQMIALVTEHGYYDLHNCYELSGYYLSQGIPKVLELYFEKVKGSWINDADPQKIKIIFNNVHYLELNISFTDKAFDTSKTLSDLNGISEIAFKPSDDFDMEWFSEESDSAVDFHIVFFIDIDNYIRVYADEIVLHIG